MKKEYVKPNADWICFDTEERIATLEDNLSQYAAAEDAKGGIIPGFGSVPNPFGSLIAED